MTRWTLLGIVSLLLTGCVLNDVAKQTESAVKTSEDLLVEVKKTGDLTQDMKELLSKTENATHLQILTVALEGLLHPNNTVILDPPSRMMPFAEAFAKEATIAELVKMGHLFLQEAKYGEDLPHTAQDDRLIVLIAASAVFGFAPKDTFRKIIEEQIEGQGVYEGAIRELVVARYRFVLDYLFKPFIEQSDVANLKGLKQAVRYFNELIYIAEHPDQEKFHLSVPPLEMEAAIDRDELELTARLAIIHYEFNLAPEVLEKQATQEQLDVFRKLLP